MKLLPKLLALSVFALASCANTNKTTVFDGFATELEEGQKFKDLRPLDSESENDLRELAFTLPILEGRGKDSMEWFYENSESGEGVEEWELPADGAQAPATLTRLPSNDEKQRIQVVMTPLPSGADMTPYIHTWVFQRIESGWEVESYQKVSY